MDRARNIKPSLYINEILGTLSPYARLLFSVLWCLADREGRLEDRPNRIKVESLPYDKEARLVMNEREHTTAREDRI